MIYEFTKQQEDKILKYWSFDFYRILHYTIQVLSEKWKLSGLEFGEYYRGNAIFFCKSEQYGNCVLRINKDGDEALDEYNTLREHDGTFHARAYEYEFGAVLCERIIPGKMLSDEPSLEKRLAIFSELFNGRHITPKTPELFGSLSDWVDFCTDCAINRREDFRELYDHALKAREMYYDMLSVYNRKLLIHLDLTNGNIVSCGDGKYKIIDPYRTVIGDPVFETGRYICGECCYPNIYPERVETIMAYLEKSLSIPNKILRQCLYLDVVLTKCEHTQWSTDCNIDGIKFAESVMEI